MAALSEITNWGHIKNQRMHPHRNRGLELVLVESGHLEWQVGTRSESLYPGSIFFTLPWQVHGSRTLREPDNRIYYFLLALPDTELKKTGQLEFPESLNFSPDEVRLINDVLSSTEVHTRTATSLIKSLFTELIAELDNDRTDSRPLCIALLKTLLLETARLFSTSEKADRSRWSAEQKISKFMAELQTRLEEPWTLERMATDCKVKRTRFADLTRQLTGYPPIKHLNRLRFETAGLLLKKTDKTVTDIAFECGYSSSQYFAEQFKKESGLTPTEYRRLAPDLDSILTVGWKNPEDRTLEAEQSRRTTFRL
jgi:AraC family L-rhamnose operon regulatory protein RhaS